MKRYLILAAVALLMVIVGIAIYLYNSIDELVESAIEKEGSRVLGTRVSVGSVDISLKTGRGTIHDISVSNPDGFSSDKLFKLDEVTVDIDVKSLNRDPIVVDEISIAAPEVRAEMNEQAQTNVMAVKNAVDKYQSASAPQARKQDGGFEKRIMIKKFVFQEGTVDLDAVAMDVQATDLELPPLHLSNVGGAHGDTPDGIAKTVSRAFLNTVRGVVEDRIKQRATDAAKQKLTEEAGKVIDKVFNKKAANDSSR